MTIELTQEEIEALKLENIQLKEKNRVYKRTVSSMMKLLKEAKCEGGCEKSCKDCVD